MAARVKATMFDAAAAVVPRRARDREQRRADETAATAFGNCDRVAPGLEFLGDEYCEVRFEHRAARLRELFCEQGERLAVRRRGCGFVVGRAGHCEAVVGAIENVGLTAAAGHRSHRVDERHVGFG